MFLFTKLQDKHMPLFIKGSVLATDFKVYDGELVNTHTSGSVHAADFNVYDGELVTHTSAGVSS